MKSSPIHRFSTHAYEPQFPRQQSIRLALNTSTLPAPQRNMQRNRSRNVRPPLAARAPMRPRDNSKM